MQDIDTFWGFELVWYTRSIAQLWYCVCNDYIYITYVSYVVRFSHLE